MHPPADSADPITPRLAPAAPTFPATRFTALRRMLQIDAQAYARDRNAVDGSVTHLSPYVTHGFVSSAEVLACWRERFGLSLADRLCQQLAWREFFQHTWRHRGDAILQDIVARNAQIAYAEELPADIRMGATGVPVIDQSVRALYATGYLHNHQRLWLASYIVHLRKVDWRSGAAWMYGHLLDGDLASNHLSWQWVAGTFSLKPYLFNAENVSRHAPWLDNSGTSIDQSYGALEMLANSPESVPPEAVRPLPQREPALLSRPEHGATGADLQLLTRGKKVALVHPWALGERPEADCVIGIIHLPFHARFPWSAARWQFVMPRMNQLCDAVFIGDMANAERFLANVASLVSARTYNPEYASAMSTAGTSLLDVSSALPDPGTACASFSAWLRAIGAMAPGLFRTSLTEQVARTRHRIDF